MSLVQNTLFDGKYSIVEKAIERLKTFEPPEGYYLAFSGGKDSIVIERLAKMSGVKFDSHYNSTGIDPPELIKFIREYYPEVKWHIPPRGFFREMIHRGFPQRQRRWCCEYLKEGGGEDRMVITGIRWAESSKRAGRKMVESCYKHKGKKYMNAIIEWTDADVWDFIKGNTLPYCELYDLGWKRLGCVMCPMSGKMRKKEAQRYPRYVRAYILAFKKLYKKKKSEGKASVDRWKDGEEMFWWWLNEDRTCEMPDQTVMFE